MRAPPILTIGSLFSGIGGLELGLERAGLGPVFWQCEIDPFCRAVLAKHWPNVTRFEDVTTKRDWPHVDLICGGFPCQDVSHAGKCAGLSGARSGLWYQFARIVGDVLPRIVVVENVTSGVRRWLPTVRRDLHVLGYRTRAITISAADVGAPHLRKRTFVVAYANCMRELEQSWSELQERQRTSHGSEDVANAASRKGGKDCPAVLGDSEREVTRTTDEWGARRPGGRGGAPGSSGSHEGWLVEPDVGRVAHGLSGGVDGRRRRARLRALGNAVVPQCAEVIGRVLLESITAHAERTGDSPKGRRRWLTR